LLLGLRAILYIAATKNLSLVTLHFRCPMKLPSVLLRCHVPRIILTLQPLPVELRGRYGRTAAPNEGLSWTGGSQGLPGYVFDIATRPV
jgi:hypothetical protein